MRGWRLIIGVVALLIVLGGSFYFYSSANSCQQTYRKDTTLEIDSKVLKIELASTAEQRQKGLGGRECIQKDQGMLFVFEESGDHLFWMKDMKFPIDMVWIDKDRKVVTVKENVSPETYPQTFVNDKPALYVLELKAKNAAKLGIKNGLQVSF